MGGNSLILLGKYLVFVEVQKVERNVKGVSFDRIGEEINVEGYLVLFHEF